VRLLSRSEVNISPLSHVERKLVASRAFSMLPNHTNTLRFLILLYDEIHGDIYSHFEERHKQ
jgi:hypothetical protein